jgi:hypothetical protein
MAHMAKVDAFTLSDRDFFNGKPVYDILDQFEREIKMTCKRRTHHLSSEKKAGQLRTPRYNGKTDPAPQKPRTKLPFGSCSGIPHRLHGQGSAGFPLPHC